MHSILTFIVTISLLSIISQTTAQMELPSKDEAVATVEHPPRGSRKTRLAGGSNSHISMNTYHVALEYNSELICQGAIISIFYVVTAAHCNVDNIDNLFVRSGSHWRRSNGTLHRVVEFIPHDNFTHVPREGNDIALVRVHRPIRTIENVQVPIAMFHAGERIEQDKLVTISSIGNARRLQQISVSVANKSMCNDMYDGTPPGTFCTGYEHEKQRACPGDSGAPVVSDNRLVGIVSYGQNCLFHEYSTVNTEIAFFRDWIFSKVHF